MRRESRQACGSETYAALSPPKGFVDNAETMNSRAAMIGFFSLLLLEAVRVPLLS